MTVHYQPATTQLKPQESRAAIGAWECTLPTQALCWTDGVYDLFGLRRGSAVRRSDILDLYEDTSRREMDRLRNQALATGRSFSIDCRIRTADGAPRWMRLIAGIDRRDRYNARIFGSKHDVTAEKGLWTELAREAQPLALATEPTLRRFDEALRQFGERAGGFGAAVAIYALDDETQLRDTFGAAACDAVLQTIEQRLGRLFPDALASGRIAGAGFALLMPMPPEAERFIAMLENGRRLLQRPLSHGPFVVDFRVSAGAATAPASSPLAAQLLTGAEAGLKAARMQGGDRLRLFDGPLLQAAR